MNRMLTQEFVNELLRDPDFEAIDHIVFGNGLQSLEPSLPDAWRTMIRRDYQSGTLAAYWKTARAEFEDFAATLESRVQQLAVGRYRQTQEYCLLYFFLNKGDVRVWVGNRPISVLPEVFASLEVDLSDLYGIHNGFFDLVYGEPGFMSVGDVEVFADEDGSTKEGFLSLFRHGTSCLGLDLESNGRDAYIIWSGDDEVGQVDSIWEELGEWLTSIIEQYDENDDQYQEP